MDNLVYGRQPVSELSNSRAKVLKVFVVDRDDPIAASLKVSGAAVVVLAKADFERRFAAFKHQHIVAEIAPFAYRDEQWLAGRPVTNDSLVVLLDGIEDPQNLGAIARSAYAAGATALLIRKDRQALVTPAVIRASAGYLLHLDVVLFTNAVQAAKNLKKRGYWIAGAVGGAKQNYQSLDVKTPLVVVIGNEHGGISRLLVEQLDFPVSIAMAPGVDSLNAAAAAAVILLDVYNRRVRH